MKPHSIDPPAIPDDDDCQPIPEPLTPLHYVAPPKPEWVVEAHWAKTNFTIDVTQIGGWFRYGGHTTESRARQSAADMAKSKSLCVDKYRIRTPRLGR